MNGSNRGRLAMSMHPLSWYTDNKITPFDGEVCYDDNTFDIYIWDHAEDGGWVSYSRTKDIQTYLDDLKNSGVFTSAAAFVNNRKIYRFYFDQINGVVRLDPELRFEPIYRYYAIRKTELTPEGAYIYITGVSGKDIEGRDVSSALVDMDEVDSESGDGTKVTVPCVGGLVETVTNGDTYIVEFFDSNRNLVNMQSYQAIAVRTADLDLSPDTAVTDIMITSNQNKEDNKSVYLYRGQDKSKLQLNVRLKYADGRSRDVTHENIEGGRLVITGLDEINTDSITPEGATPQSIRVTYVMIRSNASMPPSTTETPSGAIISPSSLTISKDIDVYIIEDIFNNLVKIIPSGYVYEKEPGDWRIGVKYFGLYETGAVHDITNITTYIGTPLVDNQFATNQNLTVSVPYGNAGKYFTKKFVLHASNPGVPGTKLYPVKIDTDDPRYITFDNLDTSAGLHDGKFVSLKVFEEGVYKDVPIGGLLDIAKETGLQGRVPTHIRVRSVLDPAFIYTDITTFNGGVYYDAMNDTVHTLSDSKPLLIEFFEVQTDESGHILNVVETNAIPHYAASTSSITG